MVMGYLCQQRGCRASAPGGTGGHEAKPCSAGHWSMEQCFHTQHAHAASPAGQLHDPSWGKQEPHKECWSEDVLEIAEGKGSCSRPGNLPLQRKCYLYAKNKTFNLTSQELWRDQQKQSFLPSNFSGNSSLETDVLVMVPPCARCGLNFGSTQKNCTCWWLTLDKILLSHT